MLTAPNWFARMRMLSTMLYPEALVDGGQFSVWIQLGNVWQGENELTVVPEDAYGSICRRGRRGSWSRLFGG
jgi:hypothetical protein